MLRAIITEAPAVAGQKRYNVGVGGIAPSGLHVYRPRYLVCGPWCRGTAREKAKQLQGELDCNLHGSLLGWLRREQP